jgi:type IV fimbrial biogenesis protein FimT
MHSRFKHSGVTLIETSVVSAIAAVVMSTVTPSFSGLIENRRVDGAATNLHADIQFVRQEAVLRNQPVRLSFYSADNSNTCYVAHTGNHADCGCDANGNATCAAPVQAIKTVAFSGADKVTVLANVNSILFDPLHGTSTPTGTLKVVAKSGRAVHHVVNVMGRVRSCSPKGNATATATAVPGYRAC